MTQPMPDGHDTSAAHDKGLLHAAGVWTGIVDESPRSRSKARNVADMVLGLVVIAVMFSATRGESIWLQAGVTALAMVAVALVEAWIETKVRQRRG